MNDDLRAQIYNTLNSLETENLLEIWQKQDTSEWEKAVFEIVQEILEERLGYVPDQSAEAQVAQILESVERYWEARDLAQAIKECDRALEIAPNFAQAYIYRGELYDELGQSEQAIADYQRAVQLDPESEDAWDNLLSIEAEIEKAFQGSPARRHLDRALEYAHEDEPESALDEIEKAQASMPGIAAAQNYLGMIFETIGQLELAIASYQKAIQLNPRFFAARKNLANAQVRLEEEQYRRVANLSPDELREISESSLDVISAETGEPETAEPEAGENPIPGWFYLDEKASTLIGWAGYRHRPGRSGLDPLETDFELAHMQGVIIRRLITRTFRTRNPVFLLLMTYVGLAFSLPLLLAVGLLFGQWSVLPILVIYSPYAVVGVALLVNVFLSLRLEQPAGDDDLGYTFF